MSLYRPFIFAVYKPVGMTSTEVVRVFRKKFPRQTYGKIGHFGTLDPFAEGVLLLGLAGALRLSPYMHELLPKRYRAVGLLGEATDSGDCTGEVKEVLPLPPDSLWQGDWQNYLIQHFSGEYWQSPHPFSAAKHKGKALYKYARGGVEVSKSPVRRFIHSLGNLKVDLPQISFDCSVSGGTYIRTLFADMAHQLQTCGHLLRLIRVGIGECGSERALTREQWTLPTDEILSYAIAAHELLPLDGLYLGANEGIRYSQGQQVRNNSYVGSANSASNSLCWVYGAEGRLLGMGQKTDSGPVACLNF